MHKKEESIKALESKNHQFSQELFFSKKQISRLMNDYEEMVEEKNKIIEFNEQEIETLQKTIESMKKEFDSQKSWFEEKSKTYEEMIEQYRLEANKKNQEYSKALKEKNESLQRLTSEAKKLQTKVITSPKKETSKQFFENPSKSIQTDIEFKSFNKLLENQEQKEIIREVVKYIEVKSQVQPGVTEKKTSDRGSEELQEAPQNIQVINTLNKSHAVNLDLSDCKDEKQKIKKIENKKKKLTTGKGLDHKEKEYKVDEFTSTDRRNRLKVINYEHKFFKQSDDFKPKTPRMPILTKIPLYTQSMVKEYTKYTPSPKRIRFPKFTPILHKSITFSSDSNQILDLSKIEGEDDFEERRRSNKEKVYVDYTGKKLNFIIHNKKKD